MAEGRGAGERLPVLRDRGDAPGRGDLATARKHLPALRAGRMGCGRGRTTPEGATHPGPVRGRLRDGVRGSPRRQAGLSRSGSAAEPIWTHSPSGEVAV